MTPRYFYNALILQVKMYWSITCINNNTRTFKPKEAYMKPRHITLIAITLLASSNVLATHGDNFLSNESLALRKVVGAIEVASLDTPTAGIPQITCDLADAAIVLLEDDNGDNPGYGVNLGTYITPSWADNHDSDADFTIPWGQQLSNFRFDFTARVFADYIIVFGRNGEELHRENIGRQFLGGTLNIRLPYSVNPARILTVRLHHIARRGTKITVFGSNQGFGGGDNTQAVALLNDVKRVLMNSNPDMYYVRARLAYVERLLR